MPIRIPLSRDFAPNEADVHSLCKVLLKGDVSMQDML
jgi:hypothetical protein